MLSNCYVVCEEQAKGEDITVVIYIGQIMYQCFFIELHMLLDVSRRSQLKKRKHVQVES